MDALRAALPKVPIIEDAACAAGALYKGLSAGALGSAASFSFHPRKSITTGEGGMITTNDGALADVANTLRNHGAAISEEQRHRGPRPYLLPEFNLLGFNYRMTDLQGSVGLVQLQKLDRFIAEREHWAAYYLTLWLVLAGCVCLSCLRKADATPGRPSSLTSILGGGAYAAQPTARLQERGIATRLELMPCTCSAITVNIMGFSPTTIRARKM